MKKLIIAILTIAGNFANVQDRGVIQSWDADCTAREWLTDALNHTEETMAKAYWVVCYRSISNPAAREAYSKLGVPAVLAAGGRFLARGMPAKT